MDLKAILCRIERFLFQAHMYHQANASYNFYNKFDHKATIVAFRPQRVKLNYPNITVMCVATMYRYSQWR